MRPRAKAHQPAPTPRGRVRHRDPRAISAGCAALLCAVSALACFGTPTPLAPGLSGSVGLPHHGVQTGAVELPARGTGYARFRTRGVNYWGQPGLVEAIERAAKRVHDELPGGAPLLVGDLSARHGGKIRRHNSHRTGRDVDLLWYVTTPRGAPIRNPDFVQIGPDGLAPIPRREGFVRLDVPRQWLLVKALLESSAISVQWMFCSGPVEALLIDYAMARGESLDLVFRAQNVLMEPGDSLPHDDHIHLRIACSPISTVRGCEGGGPRWTWLPDTPYLDGFEEAALTRLIVGGPRP